MRQEPNATWHAPGDSLLARLRSETRSEHDAIEAALNLTRCPVLELAAYRRTMERFYGFYGPLEAGLRAVGELDDRGLLLEERCAKARLLEIDLEVLGEDPRQLPRCPNLPPHAGLAQGIGCLYVLEGATLGGQVISEHVRRMLGITAASGGAFFAGYGECTGAMWLAFRAAVAAIAFTPPERDEAIAAARSTFRALRVWHAAPAGIAGHAGPRR